MGKDNTTLQQKVNLRLNLLQHIPDPVVMETHGGTGRVWFRCYQEIQRGCVLEKDEVKAEQLAIQRPTWSVYEGDCVKALKAGAGAHLPINFLDIDPYGACWDTLEAFFTSERPWPAVLGVVVNDGLRQKLAANGGWTIDYLAPVVARYGNHKLHDLYLEVCQAMLESLACTQGYELVHWTGYYCGHSQAMTHFAAVLKHNRLR